MMELDENDARWSDEARESFRTAAADLIEAIRQHSATLVELAGADADPDAVAETIAEADERIEAAAAAYADAQFELTGTVPPLGLDDEYNDELDDEDGLDELEDDSATAEPVDADQPAVALTVLHRADFVVIDEPAVIQAGKEAYHELANVDDEPVDVTDLGEALQQLRQAGGIEALAETPGLVSGGATTWIVEGTDLLDEHDPDEWPDAPFDLSEDAHLLHRLDEVAG